MRSPHRDGFSLVEMLTVMVVIFGLVGLLIPGVQGARESALTVECQDHLHYLGLAYNSRRLFSPTPDAASWAGRWPTELEPHLENSGRVFVCPRSDRGLLQQNTAARLVVTAAGGPTGVTGREVPFSPGNGRCRVTAEYQTAITSPGGYVLEFETGEDDDWNDLVLAINADPSGVLRAEILAADSTDTHAVLQPDGTIAVGGITAGNKNGTTFLLNVAGAVSYGMNAAVHRFRQENFKALLVDYRKLVADVAGPSYFDVWPEAFSDRHRGKMNVLFTGGHCQTLGPGDLDPRILRQQNQYWNPDDQQL